MHRTLRGTAELETLENDLRIEATVDKLGHIFWEGFVGGYHGGPDEARLQFHFTDDQTSLPVIIEQLEALVAEANGEGARS
jgi:hypothetical protein